MKERKRGERIPERNMRKELRKNPREG